MLINCVGMSRTPSTEGVSPFFDTMPVQHKYSCSVQKNQVPATPDLSTP
jgi:hypothetical protein